MNKNLELMSKDLTIEYNELARTIIIKDVDYEIETIKSERDNQFGNPVFDLPKWNGYCTISINLKGDHFNLFMKLDNKFYKAFQKVDGEKAYTTFNNFREVEKKYGKWEVI